MRISCEDPFTLVSPISFSEFLGTLTAAAKQDKGGCSLLRAECIFHNSYVLSMDQTRKHSELCRQEKYIAEKKRLLDSFYCFSDPLNIGHVFEGKYI